MKKDHPHPFPSSSIQELIKLYEQAAAEVSGPAPLPKEAPSKSKRLSTILEKDEERQSLLREETVTEEVTQASGRMTNPTTPFTRSSSTKRPQEPETTRATVASQRATRILSEEEITLLLQHNSLVRTYQEEIQHLSANAYGNPNILQEKMQEIQRNPAAGEELSWRMAAYPESLAKLSGTSMFGFKNRARRQAEENFSALCVTLDGYTEAVKQARESLSRSPEQELKNYERFMGKSAVAELLKKPYHREKESSSEAEISIQIHQHSKVKRHHAQIQYWCKVVFGDENILQSHVEVLFQNPEMIEQLAQQLAGNPQSFHKYAGRNFCGLKNRARRHAEAGLSHLIDATDNYATAVTQVRESLSRTQQTNQEHNETSERTQVLHQQQSVSQSVQRPDPSTVTHEGATPSTQQRETDFRPRKTAAPKSMAFAS
ncbi:BID domain-containing T4SS effector [Bartonella tribocorum]|uniref:BepH protein n=1 Tax=Bartonella tribocorum (strain DSM 28219 / CCUG 45778 / CIP 105476 / IBS 506) TaxID=382640 RepID=A9IWQ2_BART1|nr:BID domain-containing T4SS effector [Bartonella tribocorum]CAK02019.1 BepH protein [Bartonella tribocorum CIP 105476]CDO49284.1 BepE protein [Bartonella tribocorum]